MAPLPRVRCITSIEQDVIHVKLFDVAELDPSRIHAISHRFEEREGPKMKAMKVLADDKDTWTAYLTEEEVANLKVLLESFSNLWLDYVSIKQDDLSDMAQQLSVMGNIYLQGTTLSLGWGLALKLPAPEYLDRAWCMQERSFGKIKFPWNIDFKETGEMKTLKDEREKELRRFAKELINGIPDYGGAVADKLNDFLQDGETWRLGAVDSFIKRYEKADNAARIKVLGERTKELLKSKDLHDLAMTALEVRGEINLTPYSETWNRYQWQCNVFEKQALYEHDRFFGMWFVPMSHTSIPSDNVALAWDAVAKEYPGVDFAYGDGVAENITPRALFLTRVVADEEKKLQAEEAKKNPSKFAVSRRKSALSLYGKILKEEQSIKFKVLHQQDVKYPYPPNSWNEVLENGGRSITICQYEGTVGSEKQVYYRVSTIVEGEEAKKRNEQVRSLIISERSLATMDPESNDDREPFSRFFPSWYGGGAQFHLPQYIHNSYKIKRD